MNRNTNGGRGLRESPRTHGCADLPATGSHSAIKNGGSAVCRQRTADSEYIPVTLAWDRPVSRDS